MTNLVIAIKEWAIENYDEGGHWIIETMTDYEIHLAFKSLTEVKNHVKLLNDRAADICNA